MSLHLAAGTIGGDGDGEFPGLIRMDLGSALEAVSASSYEEVTRSARLDILGALARRDLPEFETLEAQYLQLAGSIGGGDVDAQTVLADVKQAAADASSFAATATARALEHHETAFFMEDVCTTERVVVNGIDAVWVFSEFETDADFATVAAWVDPNNWPARAPQMFKRMDPIAPTAPIPGFYGANSFHGEFHETVQLVERVNTQLHCDYYEQGGLFAGMTYELSRSIDGQLDVDRGFLLVNELGNTRHVKALKIVSFVNDMWDAVAMWVCPLWTEFIRGAVRGGTTSAHLPASSQPGSIGGVADSWFESMRRAAKRYAAMGVDWSDRVARGSYGPDDVVRDGARFWLQAYRDMADAAATGYAALEQLAGEPVSGGAAVLPQLGGVQGRPAVSGQPHSAATVPLASRGPAAREPAAQATTLPVPGFDPANASIVVSELRRVESDGTAIPASAVTAKAVPLTADVYGIHVEAVTTNRPPGLYVGEVTLGAVDRRPVQLYVSQAVAPDAAGGASP